MPRKLLLAGAAAAALLAGSRPAAAQEILPDTGLTYRREVFRYPRSGRPDPFRSLLTGSDLGLRVEDLTLVGVVYHADPSRSVAVLRRSGETQPIRARVGTQIGGIRVVGIRPRSVEVLVEEFGIGRRAVIELKQNPRKGETS